MMEVLQTHRVAFKRAGKMVVFQFVAIHDPTKPEFYIVVTCEGCGVELGRRMIDSSMAIAEDAAAAFGFFDGLVHRAHVCEVASC